MSKGKDNLPQPDGTAAVNAAVVDDEDENVDPAGAAGGVSTEEFEERMKELFAKAEEKANQIAAEAEKKAEEMIKSAAASVEANAADEEKADLPKKGKSDPSMEELVEVQLFYDGDKYKDPVYLSLNGENCVIQRGKPVKIKRKFANILRQSDKQDKYAAAQRNQLADDFRKKETLFT